ncbi:MAG: hypothetical protein PHC51_01035 [bacterium]|nr:hypothetical protein [bacterium]
MITNTANTHQTHPNEKGSIIALVAIVMTVLVLFAALSIDTARLFTSDSEHRHNAEFIALSAIEGYYTADFDPSDSAETRHQKRLQSAIEKAETVGGYATYMTLDSGEIVKSGSLSYPNGYTVDGVHNGNSGVIIPGRWWSEEPTETCAVYTEGSSTCPCLDGAWRGACFEEVDPEDSAISAFQVDLKTPDESPLTLLFAKAGGTDAESIGLNARAIGSLTPRRGMFLVDLSKSVVAETHLAKALNIADPGTQRGFVGYELDTSSSSCPFDGANNVCPNDLSCTFLHTEEDDTYNNFFASPPAYARSLDDIRGIITGPPTRHFKDDYRCYSVDYLDKSTATEQNIHREFLVDVNWQNTSNTSDYYVGPQPLTNILGGIHTAFSLFEQRSVRSDLAGVLGYDRSSNIDIRTLEPSIPGSDEFTDMKEMFDVSNPGDLTAKALRAQAMFFPRPDNDPVVGGGANNTDIRGAIEVALSKLANESSSATAENFIVLFTDGITNCVRSNTFGARGVDGKYCQNNEPVYNASVTEVLNYADQQLVPRKIPIHLFMFGNDVSPHTFLTTSVDKPTVCMGELEARVRGVAYYKTGGTLASASSATPFYTANQISDLAKKTNGFFLPIRPPCKVSGVNTDVTATLDAACATKGVGYVKGVYTPTAVVVPNFTDGSGRLICDPKGRTQDQQITEYMEQILGDNPFSLVR